MLQTRTQFIADYSARSGITPAQLAAMGRVAEPCGCNAKLCTGWRMVTSWEAVAPPAEGGLPHADGCRIPNHDPALSLCSNELIWPWTT